MDPPWYGWHEIICTPFLFIFIYVCVCVDSLHAEWDARDPIDEFGLAAGKKSAKDWRQAERDGLLDVVVRLF
jgi:hypothetical protein